MKRHSWIQNEANIVEDFHMKINQTIFYSNLHEQFQQQKITTLQVFFDDYYQTPFG